MTRTVSVADYVTVKDVLREAHYIGKPGSTSVRLRMDIDDQLAGVITYGTIPGNNARSICGPGYAPGVLELTRLALYDWAPGNSESWLIARSFEWLRKYRPSARVLVSYADASVGHVGTIYQATNWIYTGTSGGDVVWLCNDGRRLHPRTTGWDKTALPPGKWVPVPGKHRYVNFVGTPAERRTARRELRWPRLPYPKQLAKARG